MKISVHLYYTRLYCEELGIPIREIILIDDLAEQGLNTSRFWPKIMPEVTFRFIHAQKGDDIEYIRQVCDAIERDPSRLLADVTASTQTAGSYRKSALQTFSTFSPRGNSINSNDDHVQNTPEQSTRKIA